MRGLGGSRWHPHAQVRERPGRAGLWSVPWRPLRRSSAGEGLTLPHGRSWRSPKGILNAYEICAA